jgi:acid phosphatase
VTRCAVATDSWSITHPSLPNYLALVSGSTGGVTTDCSPATCPQRRRTVFDQVRAAGGSWRVLAESMPSPCAPGNAGRYVARHNPPTYFRSLGAGCRRWDLPMGTASAGRLVDLVTQGRLPSFLLVVPNQCHNTHDCAIRSGDRWLSRIVPLVTGGPDFREGRTAVVVTWDEGSGGHRGEDCAATRSRSCRIVTAVVAPSVAPGTRVGARLDHFALLAATEELLGLDGRLRHAGDERTTDLRTAFGL